MSVPDCAIYRPVPYTGLSKRTGNKAAVLHTNGYASGGSLYSAWLKNAAKSPGEDGYHVGAHFQIMTNGTIECYIDPDFEIGHAWDANSFAIGIETEDGGKCETPWSDKQVDAIVKLLKELGVPAQLLKEKASDGVGWHRQFASWNQSNHSCPCDHRQAQINDVVIPALKAPAPQPKEDHGWLVPSIT